MYVANSSDCCSVHNRNNPGVFGCDGDIIRRGYAILHFTNDNSNREKKLHCRMGADFGLQHTKWVREWNTTGDVPRHSRKRRRHGVPLCNRIDAQHLHMRHGGHMHDVLGTMDLVFCMLADTPNDMWNVRRHKKHNGVEFHVSTTVQHRSRAATANYIFV